MAEKKTFKKIKRSGIITYPVGDFLIRVKNAARASFKTVSAPYSNLSFEVAKVLEKQGILSGVKKEDGKVTAELVFKSKAPVLTDVKLISKPGLRIYMGSDELAEKRGASFYIISTPKGVVTTKEAVKQNIGGEVIVEIF